MIVNEELKLDWAMYEREEEEEEESHISFNNRNFQQFRNGHRTECFKFSVQTKLLEFIEAQM